MFYFSKEKLGPNMSVTPEGFLVCENVPIARTGEQLYTPAEVPVGQGKDGLVTIIRTADEVFKKESIASYAGKSIVNGHPPADQFPDGVNLDTWKELTIGTVHRPRRGEGIYDDAVVADLVFTNELAIALVHAGKREISAGYDCGYEDLGNGRGYQKDIIINHVALVENARCGPLCSIGDEDSTRGEALMKKWIESIRAAFAADDKTTLKSLLAAPPAALTADGDPGGVHLHIGEGSSKDADPKEEKRSKWDDEAIGSKFAEHEKMMGDNHKGVMDSLEEVKKLVAPKAEDSAEEKEIEGALKEEAPAGTGDVKTMKDSAPLSDLYSETVSVAEIIAPGIRYATFDASARPTKTYANTCALRRKALTLGNNEPATQGMIESANGGRALTTDSLEKMPCLQVRSLFFSVGALKRAANNNATNASHRTADAEVKKPFSIADINKRNAEFYANAK